MALRNAFLIMQLIFPRVAQETGCRIPPVSVFRWCIPAWLERGTLTRIYGQRTRHVGTRLVQVPTIDSGLSSVKETSQNDTTQAQTLYRQD